MKRRSFLRGGAMMIAGAGLSKSLFASTPDNIAKSLGDNAESLIVSAPMLQNHAETSMGVAFMVSALANGFVDISESPDMADARRIYSGGFRTTGMNDLVQQVLITDLRPATTYYYRIGAHRIDYSRGGYGVKVVDTETPEQVYSFTTAGAAAQSHICVINDTHARWKPFEAVVNLALDLSPAAIVWNGDAMNCEENMRDMADIFLRPKISNNQYASFIPYMLVPGNHDTRGIAGREVHQAWMKRNAAERPAEHWDLTRNFAFRQGDIAVIGLDTGEDKLDENPKLAGLYNHAPYRRAQAEWLKEVVKRPDIASAPFLVAFCHIPLFDDDPAMNPGDIAPDDDSAHTMYEEDFAMWQRTCGNLWGPILSKAGCQLVVVAHQHQYRFIDAGNNRSWAEVFGGGPYAETKPNGRYPTVIDIKVDSNKLQANVYNALTQSIVGTHTFNPKV